MDLQYYETDMADDALSSLELASRFFTEAQGDNRYWKWFVLSLHSAVQGAFAMSLDDGSSSLVQKPGNAKAMIDAFATGAMPPEPHMDNFLKLYKKLQSGANLTAGRKPLPISDSHEWSVAGLDEIRDEFVHFNTKGWVVDTALIRSVAVGCLEVLEYLFFTSNRVIWHEQDQQGRAQAAFAELRGKVAA